MSKTFYTKLHPKTIHLLAALFNKSCLCYKTNDTQLGHLVISNMLNYKFTMNKKSNKGMPL